MLTLIGQVKEGKTTLFSSLNKHTVAIYFLFFYVYGSVHNIIFYE